MENMIEVRHLCFEYEENQPIIQDVSFTIQKGQFVAILGHNGSGKSTIAKLLIGLLEKKIRGDYRCRDPIDPRDVLRYSS